MKEKFKYLWKTGYFNLILSGKVIIPDMAYLKKGTYQTKEPMKYRSFPCPTMGLFFLMDDSLIFQENGRQPQVTKMEGNLNRNTR